MVEGVIDSVPTVYCQWEEAGIGLNCQVTLGLLGMPSV